MQITLQTSFIKVPFFKSPFCIVVQLSFLYCLVIRIVLLCLSDSVSLVAILFEVSLAVLKNIATKVTAFVRDKKQDGPKEEKKKKKA